MYTQSFSKIHNTHILLDHRLYALMHMIMCCYVKGSILQHGIFTMQVYNIGALWRCSDGKQRKEMRFNVSDRSHYVNDEPLSTLLDLASLHTTSPPDEK
jgi:hypothetical protein